SAYTLDAAVDIGPNSLNMNNTGTFGYVKSTVTKLVNDSTNSVSNYFQKDEDLFKDLANYNKVIDIPDLASQTTVYNDAGQIGFSGLITNTSANGGSPLARNTGSVDGQY